MRKHFRGAALAVSSLAVVGGLVGGGLLSAAPASAAGPPKLKVAPSGGLTNGTVVKVSGTHFAPGDSVFVVQCIAADTSTTGSGCDLTNIVGPETPNAKGAWGPVSFTVHSGAIGTDGGTCGTTKADAKSCDISAGNAGATDTASKIIKFKVPKA